jgi:hypothetical protein
MITFGQEVGILNKNLVEHNRGVGYIGYITKRF